MGRKAMNDPRINVVAAAIHDAAHEADKEQLQLGLNAYAQVAVQALDRWLMEEAMKARTLGLPMPRLGGMKFCDCTILVNELMKPTQTERPDLDT